MPKINYEHKRFGADSLLVIAQANEILEEYEAQGFDLTLRQLYYQFVSRDLIPNNDRSYKRLGSIVNDARLAGRIDWNHIVDRTRNLRALRHWNDAGDMASWAARQFRTSLWEKQPYYVEVWIEKDALVGVIEGVCQEHDVPFFSCRGYTSQSEMWGAAQRLGRQISWGKKVRVIHLGDHDPSGIDMTRDIADRLDAFLVHDAIAALLDEHDAWDNQDEWHDDIRLLAGNIRGELFGVERIALTMDQVRETGAPPNPAKLTDARARGYIERYGDQSWELDALPPTYIDRIIREEIGYLLDGEQWSKDVAVMEHHREILNAVSREWHRLPELLGLNGSAS